MIKRLWNKMLDSVGVGNTDSISLYAAGYTTVHDIDATFGKQSVKRWKMHPEFRAALHAEIKLPPILDDTPGWFCGVPYTVDDSVDERQAILTVVIMPYGREILAARIKAPRVSADKLPA